MTIKDFQSFARIKQISELRKIRTAIFPPKKVQKYEEPKTELLHFMIPILCLGVWILNCVHAYI